MLAVAAAELVAGLAAVIVVAVVVVEQPFAEPVVVSSCPICPPDRHRSRTRASDTEWDIRQRRPAWAEGPP